MRGHGMPGDWRYSGRGRDWLCVQGGVVVANEAIGVN